MRLILVCTKCGLKIAMTIPYGNFRGEINTRYVL